jgi:diacylglycerol kinase family enzyme
MRIQAILNGDGGTLKTADTAALSELLAGKLREHGHEVDVDVVRGKEIASALEKAVSSDAIDCLVVGGGDGSVSLAASLCWKHGKVLGILPAGTMNLFARSIGMPLVLEEAVEALGKSEVRQADICTVNDHAFVHQVSIGVQPRMVELRKEKPYKSRLGKIKASFQSAFQAMTRPPTFRAKLKTGTLDSVSRYSILAVSNNVYGDGHLPFADIIDGGTLGIYTSGPLTFWMNVKLAFDMMFGRWTSNEHFLSQSGDRVCIEILTKTRGRKMSVDGELLPLTDMLDIRLHPRELKVLAPAGAFASVEGDRSAVKGSVPTERA